MAIRRDFIITCRIAAMKLLNWPTESRCRWSITRANWRDDGDTISKKKALETIHLHLPIWQQFSFLCRNSQFHGHSWFLSHSDRTPIHCSLGWAIKAIPCRSQVQWQSRSSTDPKVSTITLIHIYIPWFWNHPNPPTYGTTKTVRTFCGTGNTEDILDFTDRFTNKVCHANARSECQRSGQIPGVLPTYWPRHWFQVPHYQGAACFSWHM